MTFMDKMKTFLGNMGVPQDDLDTLNTADFHAELDPAAAAKIAELETKVAQFAAQGENDRKAKVAADARAFYTAQLTAGKVLPHMEPSVIAQFSQAAEDDIKAPSVITFSADKDGKAVTGTRVDALTALFGAMPSHGLTAELAGGGRQLTDADFKALFSRDSAAETPEERDARIDKAAAAELAAHGIAPKK